jgi:hypothetical protein
LLVVEVETFMALALVVELEVIAHQSQVNLPVVVLVQNPLYLFRVV